MEFEHKLLKYLRRVILPSTHCPGCGCGQALRDAIITDRARIPPQARERLGLLIGKYL